MLKKDTYKFTLFSIISTTVFYTLTYKYVFATKTTYKYLFLFFLAGSQSEITIYRQAMHKQNKYIFHHWVKKKSHHTSFNLMMRFIDPMVKTTLCIMQDPSHLCVIKFPYEDILIMFYMCLL